MKRGKAKRIAGKEEKGKGFWILWILLAIILLVMVYFAMKNLTGFAVNDSYESASIVPAADSSSGAGGKIAVGIPTYSKKCSDSDGGIDYYKYGEVSWRKIIFKDKCIGKKWIYEKYCKTPDKRGNSVPLTKVYKCLNGCKDGKCIEKGDECYDSDKGANYYEKGKVTGFDIPTGKLATAYDSCEGENTLNEYVCEGVYGKETEYTCPNGCKDGACIGEETSTCTDSDGGKDYAVKGKTIGLNIIEKNSEGSDTKVLSDYQAEVIIGEKTLKINISKNYYVDFGMFFVNKINFVSLGNSQNYVEVIWKEVDDTCDTSNELVERYCDSNNLNSYERYICPNGCSDGACIATTPTPTPTPTCTDSDGGKNYTVRGTVFRNNGKNYTDLCYQAEKRIFEYFCKPDGTSSGEWYNCTNGCKDGACIQATQASVTVISPNGGEIMEMGKTYNITWTSNGISEVYIYIFGYNEQGVLYLSLALTPSTISASVGSYAYTVPKTMPASDKYKIVVQSGNIRDLSDNYFSIVSSTCTDTDGGKDYYVKGTVTSKGYNYTDICYEAVKKIFEYFCKPDGTSSGEWYNCTNGCKDGACIS